MYQPCEVSTLFPLPRRKFPLKLLLSSRREQQKTNGLRESKDKVIAITEFSPGNQIGELLKMGHSIWQLERHWWAREGGHCAHCRAIGVHWENQGVHHAPLLSLNGEADVSDTVVSILASQLLLCWVEMNPGISSLMLWIWILMSCCSCTTGKLPKVSGSSRAYRGNSKSCHMKSGWI